MFEMLQDPGEAVPDSAIVTLDGSELVAPSEFDDATVPRLESASVRSPTVVCIVPSRLFRFNVAESSFCNCCNGMDAMLTARVSIDWKSCENWLTPVKTRGANPN